MVGRAVQECSAWQDSECRGAAPLSRRSGSGRRSCGEGAESTPWHDVSQEVRRRSRASSRGDAAVRTEATTSRSKSRPAGGRGPCRGCPTSWVTCGRARQGASSTWMYEKQCRQPCSQPTWALHGCRYDDVALFLHDSCRAYATSTPCSLLVALLHRSCRVEMYDAPPWRRPLHWLLLRLGLIIVPVCTPRLCLGMRSYPTLGQGRVPVLEDVEGDDTLHCH